MTESKVENKNKIKRVANRLINSKNPYLRQHAYNFVDWHLWGDEAFLKAKKEDKPIFLSIGYSTCHWCHVMAHESFDDQETASLMNKFFINIKLDREERPDLDNQFMNVCIMMNQRGGWPLTIILTPELKPFFAGTYISKEDSYGKIGLKSLMIRINDLWTNDKENLLESATDIVNILKNTSVKNNNDLLDKKMIDEAYIALVNSFDNEYGGFLPEPKFPSPHNLTFLLNYWSRNRNSHGLSMVEKTLHYMSYGGIKDQIGFGFHRYSTDMFWLVPHFEKMLYDQATISKALIDTFQITKNNKYKVEAEKIFEYVFRNLTYRTSIINNAESLAFFSAEDADSEGKEGEFYLWTLDELKTILTEEEFLLSKSVFNLTESGNFLDESSKKKTGKNIIHLKKSIKQLSKEKEENFEQLQNKIEIIHKKLFDKRKQRISPLIDTKILTDWNALMIVSLAKAGKVFADNSFIDNAKDVYYFIEKNLSTNEGQLLHIFIEKETKIPGMIDDYAYLIWGLLELYYATFELYYLNKAIKLIDITIKLFWDKENNNGFFYTAMNASQELFIRRKEIYDGALPSANSVMAMNLLRVARLLTKTDYEQKAEAIFNMASKNVNRVPTGHTALLTAMIFYLNSKEVIIIKNSQQSNSDEIIAKLNSFYLPNVSILVLEEESENPEQIKLLEAEKNLRNYHTIENKTTFYICKNFSCKQPVTELEDVLMLINED